MTLPVSGPVYLDASGFIYSVEHIEPYRAPFEAMWQQALNRQFTIVRSDLVVWKPSSSRCETMTALLKPYFVRYLTLNRLEDTRFSTRGCRLERRVYTLCHE